MPNVFDYVNGEFINRLVSTLKSKLATVALSGKYSDLSGQPTIPLAVSVKGNNESTYRTGEVNLTAENVGALPESKILTPFEPEDMPNNADFNDYIEIGVYRSGGTNLGQQNVPIFPDNGYLYVYKLREDYTNRILQFWIGVYSGVIKYRYKNASGVWANWENLVTKVKGANETTYRGGNVNLTPENIGAVPVYNSTIIGADTDWNTIVNPGSYKVQGAVMNEANHAPIGLYNYGTLIVHWAEANTGETRKIQMYLPNSIDGQKHCICYRHVNSGTWGEWAKIYDSITNDATYVKKSAAEITGKLTLDGIGTFKRSTGQGVYQGTQGTAGWIVIAQIKINSAYINHTFELEVGGRGRQFGTILSIMFDGVTNDPALDGFKCYGGSGSIFRIKKTATSTWQLIAQKNEGYGAIYVMRVNSAVEFNGGNGIVITYPNTQLSGEPDSTWIAPTLGGEIGKAETLISYDAAVTHRNQFRGKNLGTSFTAAQKTVIANGSFDDLYVGDYWVINGVTWRIVDINYWINTGDTACTTPHLVIMPDTALYNAQMNDTNTTVGGYVGSKMYTENLENAKTLINAAFGAANILNHREYLTNAVSNGYPSAGAWYDSKVELPNEIMMYGSYVFTAAGDGSFVPNRYTIDKTQLALMKMYPRFINPHRQWNWLRDVVSGADFALVADGGYAASSSASNSAVVRPFFGLKG